MKEKIVLPLSALGFYLTVYPATVWRALCVLYSSAKTNSCREREREREKRTKQQTTRVQFYLRKKHYFTRQSRVFIHAAGRIGRCCSSRKFFCPHRVKRAVIAARAILNLARDQAQRRLPLFARRFSGFFATFQFSCLRGARIYSGRGRERLLHSLRRWLYDGFLSPVWTITASVAISGNRLWGERNKSFIVFHPAGV